MNLQNDKHYGAWFIDEVLIVTEAYDTYAGANDAYCDNPNNFTPEQLAAAKWRGPMTGAEIKTALMGLPLSEMSDRFTPGRSNLTKHRRAVVAEACEVLRIASLMQGDDVTDTIVIRAEFEGEPLSKGEGVTPREILDVADACDGIDLRVSRGGYSASIYILWGNGTGACVHDYSAKLDDVPEMGSARMVNIKDLLDYVEFLDI